MNAPKSFKVKYDADGYGFEDSTLEYFLWKKIQAEYVYLGREFCMNCDGEPEQRIIILLLREERNILGDNYFTHKHITPDTPMYRSLVSDLLVEKYSQIAVHIQM